MHCEPIKLPGGGTGIICGRGSRRKPCHYCAKHGGFLCDHPVIRNGKRTTCDTQMCEQCRNNVAGADLCRPHFTLYTNNGNKFKLGDVVTA